MNLFLDVFPNIKLADDLMMMVKDVEVSKVAANKAFTLIRIYIESHHIIDKKSIYELERIIKNTIYAGNPEASVRINETFRLSSQYTAESFFNEYKDSMSLELRNTEVILSSVLDESKVSFNSPNEMIISLPKTVIAEEMYEKIVEYMDMVFKKRANLNVNYDVDYYEVDYELSNLKKDAMLREKVMKIEKVLEKVNDDAITFANKNDVASFDNDDKNKAVKKQENTTENKESKRFFKNDKGNFRERTISKSNNPDVIYGRDFDEEYINIVDIEGENVEIVIRGMIVSTESRELRKTGNFIIIYNITDFTDTISFKLFVKPDDKAGIEEALKVKGFYKLKGMVAMDPYSHELSLSHITGIKKSFDFRVPRIDNAVEKRVELHCHTKMSDSDGVSAVEDIMDRVVSYGHKAFAITDHGNVQAFPLAFHHIKDHYKDADFKIIYGMEGYIVDDTLGIAVNSKNQQLNGEYVVFDLETTGLSAANDKIIEIGAVKVINGVITDRFSTFVNPNVPIPYRIVDLTGISDEMVINAETIEEVLPKFMEFVGDAVLVAHNAAFDTGFINAKLADIGVSRNFTIVDTISMARCLIPTISKYTLDHVAKTLKISLDNHHRAVDDAECTAEIFIKLCNRLKDAGLNTLDEANAFARDDEASIRKLPHYHIIFLAKNETGRVNLYRIVSESHLKYYNRVPCIPKSFVEKHREGIIIGAACIEGELGQALVRNKSDSEIANIVSFYDYLEVQPVANNMFMLRGDKKVYDTVEDLRDINRKIVKLGEQFNKPVCATCDVHYLDPEDEIYRRIILVGKGFADEDSALYLRTTEEMLEEFSYLGAKKAEEVVIKNTNMIADMCEYIEPVRPDKCPPVIPNSDAMLREICYHKAHSMYGEELPKIVAERLERELNSIIGNGYAVMYIIAQKLVWKSVEDGYLVGSRGSVGSSFVATMAGITEVNPLSPHYYCKECHYSDFDSAEVKAYAGMAGCDMPDKICPKCGAKLMKDGFDIPFETFLGFEGDKEPDIDLNFSGEYQTKAHKYTEVIFGEGQTFRAGTIGTLADKTAYGLVKKYYEDHGIHKREAEINRLLLGCVGVRRTTGQHPGGIVVLPIGEDINSFTPIQHPADDITSDIITTHFEYHSIDHNLLKLDILGHDDPTMVRRLQDLSGVDPMNIPFDDQKVMSLFKNTDALGITPEQIDGCQTGSLGLPEFGTDFVIQMLLDAKPQCFSDLIRISGLSHGTDVWLNNAQDLILAGTATISTAICTRDDIMTYLIHKGLDPEMSFKIMEDVRKGKVAKGASKKWDEWKQEMIDHDVPEWYIDSCNKIKYMFPRAHAAAYVMMAWRIAYWKVYYPLCYYAAYFSIRAELDYELMCQGEDKLRFFMNSLKNKDNPTAKEKDMLKDMRSVLEMYARGYEFTKLDIYKAHPRDVTIIDGKLMPPISSVSGLGGVVADNISEAAKDGPFLSKDDFKSRAKVGASTIELLDELGIIDLPESNQLSLFDLV